MMRAVPGVQRRLLRQFSTGLGLSDIPGPKAWPVVGALPDWLRRVDGMKEPKGPLMVKAHNEYYQEFGDIYKLSLVGEQQVTVCRPESYMQMYRNEGLYPMGGVENLWATKKWAEETDKNVFLDWSGSGEPWRKIRMVVQEDIIGPKTARSYLPYINEAVGLASPHLPDFAKKPDEFGTRLAFDMFSSLFYGVQMKTSSPSARPEHMEFVRNTSAAFRLLGTTIFNPHLKMGIFRHHPVNRKFRACFQHSYDHSCQLLEQALELSKDMPAETKPYIVRVIDRESMPVDDIKEVAASIMLAGIDTTQSVINWNLLYLAMNPEKQELLRTELREVLGEEGITEQIAANMKSKLPYLRAVIRETHRVAPPAPMMTLRPAPCDLVLQGYAVPQGTSVGFNIFSLQNDPKYVEDPSEFKPERWLPEAIEARKGTEAEVIDDKLLATPFSFGARMCLGGRVADLEISVALARLIRDWRITLHPEHGPWKNLQPLMTRAHPFPAFSVEAA